MQPQRRASHGGSEKKSAWRKMQVYHNEEATGGTETPSLETGQTAQEQALCAEEPKPQEFSGNTRGGLEAQERRRFSASELMTRLHSSLRLGRTATRALTSGSGAGITREGKLPVRESRRAEMRVDSVSLSAPVDPNEVHGGLLEPSGVLATLSLRDCKLQEAKFELITSEASYIHSLSVAVGHFLGSVELSECLGTQDKQWLFSKLPEVKSTSERFLHDLEQRLEADVLRFSVCDVVLHHCPAFRRVYLPYVTNQAYQERTYQRLLLENPKFPGILARLEESPVCQRLPLTSFLILPFQRVTRLKMLVENILKRTAPGSQDEDMATKAFSALKELVQECNSSVQSMKRTEELIHLSKKIHFEGKIFPLISQARWLVRHGELVELAPLPAAPPAKLKLSSKAVYLHLFNDCLLLSRRKELGKFAVFVHANMAELQVRDLSLKLQGIPGHVFLLRLLHGQRARHQLLLRARTESEKQRWISALRPASPQEDKQVTCDGEDRPQVQCVRTYKALQPDELTLEKTDILAVKTRTSDGWLEGVRLADGEKGWVPQAHVEEISSLSARLRNLRENKRVTNASSKLGDPPA
ncbi:Rho guanine nucleotide exchange factor 19 [Cricetulus griseus]|uniref:Rho guanine nucleotide exchange factor 19 n=1 Tax=Cricetulus griseus TaxID=10029 RepID=G3I862_CRIGR|nr:Rho guanine nucleotide exchange factor 19 [Cricetulus griseus]